MAQRLEKTKTQNFYDRIADVHNLALKINGYRQSVEKYLKSLDLKITMKDKAVELTGAAVAIAVLLLTIGGLLMINWFGRIL